MTDHPITPPPELVEQWAASSPIQPSDESWAYELFIAHQAARWGADQMLEACCEWLRHDLDAYELVGLRAVYLDHNLRTARRPKPPSLKEQALKAAQRFYAKGHEDCTDEEVKDDFDIIRRALEQLDD